MKIIYTRKSAREGLRKKLALSFECLLLALVMCTIGLLWSKRGFEDLEESYETTAIDDSIVFDIIELQIPASSKSNLESEYIASKGEMPLFERLFLEKQEKNG